MAVQQVAQQEHQDKVLLAATTLALLHTHPAAAGVHLQLAQMVSGLHLARGAQELHPVSLERP
jgi:hypothetical protein